MEKGRRYRLGCSDASAQHGLPEEQNMPAQHFVNMQKAAAVPAGNT